MALFNLFGSKATSGGQLTASQQRWAQTLSAGVVSVKDIIAPPAIEVDFDYIKIG